MKQALHIFLKDVRGLWIQIIALVIVIACFAFLDLHANSKVVIAMELIVTAAVWFLLGRAIHEDGLADDDEFWLTRPYERSSLLGAKVLMTIIAVASPLLVADSAILATAALPVVNRLGDLVLRQFYLSLWLIVPPFAIASVTRNTKQNVLAWLALAAIATLTWFPGVIGVENDFRFTNEKYMLAVALLLAVAVVWLQFSRRGTTVSRVAIATAVLLPAPPFPESAALAIEQLRNHQSEMTSRISVTAAARDVAEPAATGYHSSRHCVNVPVRVEGVPAGWQAHVLSQNDTFESDRRTWGSGWHQVSSPSGFLPVCAVGNPDAKPISVRSIIALAVYQPEKPVHLRATLEPFEAPGIGKCQFVKAMQHGYALHCSTAVWMPPYGEAGVAGRESPAAPIAPTEFPWTPLGLMPGLSPVYRWTTLEMDEGLDHFDPVKGGMPNFGLLTLMHDGGEIEFRPLKRITVLQREISVREIRFAETRN